MDTTIKKMRSVLLAHLAAIAVAAVSGCSAGDESPSVGTAASAWRSFTGNNHVTVYNRAGFDMSFWVICVNPDGMKIRTAPSGNFSSAANATIDLDGLGIVEGANCWVSANIVAGPDNHESGDNFTYRPNGRYAVYEMRGVTVSPSWNLILD